MFIRLGYAAAYSLSMPMVKPTRGESVLHFYFLCCQCLVKYTNLQSQLLIKTIRPPFLKVTSVYRQVCCPKSIRIGTRWLTAGSNISLRLKDYLQGLASQKSQSTSSLLGLETSFCHNCLSINPKAGWYWHNYRSQVLFCHLEPHTDNSSISFQFTLVFLIPAKNVLHKYDTNIPTTSQSSWSKGETSEGLQSKSSISRNWIALLPREVLIASLCCSFKLMKMCYIL